MLWLLWVLWLLWLVVLSSVRDSCLCAASSPAPAEEVEEEDDELTTLSRHRLLEVFREAVHWAQLHHREGGDVVDTCWDTGLGLGEFREGDEEGLRRLLRARVREWGVRARLGVAGGEKVKDWRVGGAKMDRPEYLAGALARLAVDRVDGAGAMCEVWAAHHLGDLHCVTEMVEHLVFDSEFRDAVRNGHPDCFASVRDALVPLLDVRLPAKDVLKALRMHGEDRPFQAYFLALSAGLHLAGLDFGHILDSKAVAPVPRNETAALILARAGARMDDPVAHLILAQHYGANRTASPTTEARRGSDVSSEPFPLDCERALGHLIMAVSSTASFVQEQIRGGNLAPERLSLLTEDGAVDFVSLSTRAEFDTEVQHWMHQVNEFQEPHDMLAAGEMLLYGAPDIGVAPRPEQAARLFQDAARLGNGPAAAHLAHMVHDGVVQNPDPTKSVNESTYAWYEAAAKAGEPSGYTGMAYFHQYGGLPSGVNLTEALRLYDIAAAMNFSDADYRAGVLLSHIPYLPKEHGGGWGDGQEPNYTDILRRWLRASDMGHVLAALEAGFLYYSDVDDVDASCAKATRLFLKVARADWVRVLNFHASRGWSAFHRHAEVDAARVYAMAGTALWEPEGFMNLAWLLEFGKPPRGMDDVAKGLDVDGDAALGEKASCAHQEGLATTSTLSMIFAWIRDMGRVVLWWTGAVRTSAFEDPGRGHTQSVVRLLYSHASRDGSGGMGEAWRRLGDCHATCNLACERDEALATYLYKRAADMRDGQATWNLAVLRALGFGTLKPNVTQSLLDLDRVLAVDWQGGWAAWLAGVWLEWFSDL